MSRNCGDGTSPNTATVGKSVLWCVSTALTRYVNTLPSARSMLMSAPTGKVDSFANTPGTDFVAPAGLPEMWPRTTAAPTAPGRTPRSYQEASSGFSTGGTVMLPSGLVPSPTSSDCAPIAGIVILVGSGCSITTRSTAGGSGTAPVGAPVAG